VVIPAINFTLVAEQRPYRQNSFAFVKIQKMVEKVITSESSPQELSNEWCRWVLTIF
jgi:hypothetical protein